MKLSIGWILVLVAACAGSSLVTYQTGHHRGYESGYKNASLAGIQRGNFFQSVAALAALQKLRTNDVAGTTRFLEEVCFNSAEVFYKQPALNPAEVSDWGRARGLATNPGDATAKEFARQLVKYRSVYRTNSADWTDLERKLAVQLTTWK
jgi:hypothetical protein